MNILEEKLEQDITVQICTLLSLVEVDIAMGTISEKTYLYLEQASSIADTKGGNWWRAPCSIFDADLIYQKGDPNKAISQWISILNQAYHNGFSLD